MGLRTARCPGCRQPKVVTAIQGTKGGWFRIRQHFLPSGPIPDRRKAGEICSGSRKRVHADDVAVVSA